ncbi:hypothetical protein CA13_48100 [Planctomycetes bacterium CA13]|uniref:Carbohydrate-binding family 6 protein n=1 Tax=Novipirellula herctigrandis TaxID=2527986 RepID=A0A5C5Z7X6_9BACT|nr:hypothetical protein CA13_48100 [Planctomycetes bacterium CA13]
MKPERLSTIFNLFFFAVAFQAIFLVRPLAAVEIEISHPSSQTDFAADAVRNAFASDSPNQESIQGNWRIRFVLDSNEHAIEPEGFRIQTTTIEEAKQVEIRAIDAAGLLYGGLEIAEVARTRGPEKIVDGIHNPYMAMRGTKFNIPLDVRSPSYTDVCDAAQNNIPEMWNFEFWKEYIDTLAHYRYNFVSLWNLHPFPSMVKVPEYPDVALDEVWRSKGPWDEHYSLSGRGFVTEKILADVEVINTMTINEKIDFWKRVMAYGKSRNVKFFVVTWNIFTYGADDHYGINDDPKNETTKDYFRQSVKQMFLTYPDLAGVGLTTGENMNGMDFQAKEDWAMATYGQGVLDAAKVDPNRKITFIHRQHMAKANDISRTFKPLTDQPNVDFIFSFKYAKAHVYSATKQYSHHAFVKDLGDLETIWTLRNDDIYYFRWGAPNFVREFIKNIPYDVSRGYYYGSDQWIWGREFLQRDADEPRQLEIDKHWMQWMLWGRLGFDPDLEREHLVGLVADRFGLDLLNASGLLDAWQNASMIYPTTTGFHWGSLDFQWYIEACQSTASYAQNKTGFHDVNRFISLPPHPNSGNQSIPDFVAGKDISDQTRTPMQVADQLDKYVRDAQKSLRDIPDSGENRERARTLVDIQIICHLGLYYADKIRGATEVALFRKSKAPDAQQKAIAHLTDAAEHFKAYADLAAEHHHKPLWTNRVGYVDWEKTYQYVLDDIRIAGQPPLEK